MYTKKTSGLFFADTVYVKCVSCFLSPVRVFSSSVQAML